MKIEYQRERDSNPGSDLRVVLKTKSGSGHLHRKIAAALVPLTPLRSPAARWAFRYWNACEQALCKVRAICRPRDYSEAEAWVKAEHDRQVKLAVERPWPPPLFPPIADRLAERLAAGEEVADAIRAEEAVQALRERESDVLLTAGISQAPWVR